MRRGQLVFARAKASCTSCHQFGYAGGHIGPDLTHVGNIRSERDLLEAIMFPSASIVRSFEPMQVITKSGKVYNGLVHKDAPDEIVLIASATETVHVPRDEIEECVPAASRSCRPASTNSSRRRNWPTWSRSCGMRNKKRCDGQGATSEVRRATSKTECRRRTSLARRTFLSPISAGVLCRVSAGRVGRRWGRPVDAAWSVWTLGVRPCFMLCAGRP